MQLPRQPNIMIHRHPLWFESAAPRLDAGREHRDGVLRGLAFVAAMIGFFVLLTAAGGASDPDRHIVHAHPSTSYVVAALDGR